LKKKKYFLKEFFKEKKTVGAVSPSSKTLGRSMLKNIDFSSVSAIAEYGPGNGVFTRMILEHISPDTKLLVFELHDTFYKKLEKEFADNDNVIMINDSAENISHYLKENNLEELDVIVSSLPLANFDKEVKSNILNSSHKVLNSNGMYVQFQYSLNSKKQLKKLFSSVSIDFTAKNIPPAFVYTCYK
jgi:phospholipid N-methyltransferase